MNMLSSMIELLLHTLCWLQQLNGQSCLWHLPSSSPEFAVRTSPIKTGYTAFGDSYAAGIGTGKTSPWGCRQGRFSYPDIIGSTAPDIDFQNLACSGARVPNLLSGGPDSQIDAWTNPTATDIATISIGGNDIGFYNMLTACVLWIGGPWAGDCDTEIAKAYELMDSPIFSAEIASVLTHIIDKNGKEGFKIYMTGYATFFNATTILCESSTFRIYNPHYDHTHEETGQPFLTMALRTRLNDAVSTLNTILSDTVDSVNAHYANAQKVIFVDPNPAYAGHRWCEEGVFEPDIDRNSTWFFLSSSADNNLPDDALGAAESYNQELSEQCAGPSFPLPDPNTCRETLKHSHSVIASDWYENMLCDISSAGSKASSLEQQVLMEDAAIIQQGGNLSSLRIPWYVPTKLAKSFHPRTLGQEAFAKEIMALW